MINEKIKAVMICSFSNAKVREHLPLSNRRLYALGRRILGLSTSRTRYCDVAGWDTYMIELLRQREDIELHVIAAHSGLKTIVTSFELEGVHYNFIRIEEATLLKHLISSPALWHKLNPMRPVVRRLVKQIKPDVIALIGAENAHISGTVLGIQGIPLIVKCQTIYNNPEREIYGTVDSKNAYVERLIFRDLHYVAVGAGSHRRLFRQFNQMAYNFKWPLGNLLPEVKLIDKEFDFVNFAMTICAKKGFPDALQAIAIVKNKYPKVKLNFVGGGTTEEIKSLHRMAKDLDVMDNVIFTPFFERQEDLFQHLQKSRFALLPCKMDSVASTIRQAMHYELPVICYKTDGTSRLNQDKECVIIAQNSNIEDLANKMILLLDNAEKADELRHNAKEYSLRWCNDEAILRQMADIFHAVVENYRYGTPIPEQLLCDESK